jgi:O-antigen/teichoic acid export membrane protein
VLSNKLEVLADRWMQTRRWFSDNGLSRRLAINSSWAISSQLFALAAVLIETFLLARILGISSFGILMLMVAVVELVYGVLDCRSGEVVIKYLPELKRIAGDQATSALLYTVILIDVCLAIIGFALIWLSVKFFGFWVSIPAHYLSSCLYLAVGYGLVLTMRSIGSYLRVIDRFPLAAKLAIAGSTARIIFIIMLIPFNPNVQGACVAIGGAEAAMFTMLFSGLLIGIRKNNARPFAMTLKLPNGMAAKVFRFMFHTNLSLTLRVIAKKGDVIAIAALSSTGVVALYKIAMRLAGTLMLIGDPLVTVLYPTLSQYYAQGRYHDIRRLIRLLTVGAASAAFLLLIAFAFLGEWLIGLFAGRDFIVAYHGSMIMIGAALLATAFFWTRPLQLVYEQTGQLLIIGIIATVLRFAGITALVPILGLAGAAWSFVIYNLAAILGSLISISKHNRDISHFINKPIISSVD